MTQNETNAANRNGATHLTEHQVNALLEATKVPAELTTHLSQCSVCQTRLAVMAQSELELLLAARTFRAPTGDRLGSPARQSADDAASYEGVGRDGADDSWVIDPCELDEYGDEHSDEHSGVRTIGSVVPWYRRRVTPRNAPQRVSSWRQFASCCATVLVLGGTGLLSFWTQPMRGGARVPEYASVWSRAGCPPSQSWCAVSVH